MYVCKNTDAHECVSVYSKTLLGVETLLDTWNINTYTEILRCKDALDLSWRFKF